MTHFFILFLFLFSISSQATTLEQAGTGCPDGTCIWILGQNFGQRPAVKIISATDEWTIPFQNLGFTKTDSQDFISLSLPLGVQILALEKTGLQVAVLNDQTLTLSNFISVDRSGFPRFPDILKTEPLASYEAGGTNYTVVHPPQLNPEDIYNDIQMLIPSYHTRTALIQNTLQKMYENGQRKLSLVIWYTVQTLPECTAGIMVSIVNGDLCSQHKKNLRDILTYVYNLGFNEVFIRFANYGNVGPGAWTTFNETLYSQVESMIHNVRNDLELAFSSVPQLKRTYDLCLECGGLNDGLYPEFVRRLYKSYVQQYGPQDTVGVSFAYYPGRIESFYKTLTQNNLPFPKEVAVDIYKTTDADFFRLKQELMSMGVSEKPVVLLETYYNNGATAAAIRQARETWHLNLRTALQWQYAEGGVVFQIAEPTEFAAYVHLAPPPSVQDWTSHIWDGAVILSANFYPKNKYIKAEFYSADGLDDYLGVTNQLVESKGPYFLDSSRYSFSIPTEILLRLSDRKIKVKVYSQQNTPTEISTVIF